MDPSEMDALVERLVANPHDEEALAVAHQSGHSDPTAYATLLEKVGGLTSDPSYAAHWLSEAANVWLVTLGDAHRAARTLMAAVDKDPSQRMAADRLAQLYREKGDLKALAALLERRAKALAPLAAENPELVGELATIHEELGRMWNEPPLSQPKKALECFRRAIELDSRSTFALFHAREILKGQGAFDETYPLYEAEYQLETDPARRIALLRDEAESRRSAGDLAGVSRTVAKARQLDGQDPALQQEYAASVLDRIHGGEKVAEQERLLASELLVGLAEQFDGEHGLAYAGAALDADPGHDRGLQLFVYYARSLRHDDRLAPRFAQYLETNPRGAMASEARQALASSYETTGQVDKAIELLEPLRAAGDASAATKIEDLMAQSGSQRVPNLGRSGYPVEATGMTEVSSMPGAFAHSSNEGSGRPRGMGPDAIQGLLDTAQMLAGKGKKPEAFVKYKEVLDIDPGHPEALSWAEDYLRSKREYAQLREVLVASVRVLNASREANETRKERLREIAGLCEGNLRDIDGAIAAWRQLIAIDRGDDSARQSLTRLLERTQRWADLATLLEQEATAEPDLDTKIALEKKLANLSEQKLRDFVGAAEAWSRIARLVPDDDRALITAAKLFEKGNRLDLAAQVIDDGAHAIDEVVARSQLFERLGELREQLGEFGSAGDAFAEAAKAQESVKLWESAERCFVESDRFAEAGNAATQRALLGGDPKQQSMHYARSAEHYGKAHDEDGALRALEQAIKLDPTSEETATQLAARYAAQNAWEELIQLLSKRSQFISDKSKRVSLRRQAATMAEKHLADQEAARELWLRVLDDGDDREALEKLIDFAIKNDDHTEAATLLRRVGAIAVDKADKARVALREAELLAEGVGDIDTAIARYEAILTDLDPTCRPALQAIADLQEARENPGAATDALERELKLVADSQERGSIASRLARLYESLDDPRAAIRALDIVRKSDPDDFDALARLSVLCERQEQWDRVAELLAEQIEIEGDEDEAAKMTSKLALILADKLDRGDEALATLTELADQGHAQIRAVYMELGDRLGWKGLVASKLVEWWFDARNSPERLAALRDAFERFCAVGRDQDATRVALEIVRAKAADRALAERLEELAVKTGDSDALSVAHELLAREYSGAERAAELVRQSEVMVRAGVSPRDAMQHGEAGLGTLPLSDVEPLLDRLSAIAEKASEVVDLYERQVSRSRQPQDRVRALARAAQVAASRSLTDRARAFFELALAGASPPAAETIELLEQYAAEGDKQSGGGDRLRRALCASFAQGGGGARDGGRTRAMLLRRAAILAERDLHDVDQAFLLLGDALISHVEVETLDAIEALGVSRINVKRSEEVVSRALAEVFDGPLVRQLLSRRAKLRREHLGDLAGAAVDLRKLHDLSPHDQAVLDELYLLLRDLGDYRGMVQLYEDQILRGKDLTTRADLARKVARMWEEQLSDAREAADAWRRVLRMKPGDPEGAEGLERAKANALKRPDPNADPDVYAPPRLSAPPSAPPRRPSNAPSGSPASGPSSARAGEPASKRPSAPAPPLAPNTAASRPAASAASPSASWKAAAGRDSVGRVPLPPLPPRIGGESASPPRSDVFADSATSNASGTSNEAQRETATGEVPVFEEANGYAEHDVLSTSRHHAPADASPASARGAHDEPSSAHAEEHAPPDAPPSAERLSDSDFSFDDDESSEHETENGTHGLKSAAYSIGDDEHDVVIADDLAEMVDDDSHKKKPSMSSES